MVNRVVHFLFYIIYAFFLVLLEVFVMRATIKGVSVFMLYLLCAFLTLSLQKTNLTKLRKLLNPELSNKT